VVPRVVDNSASGSRLVGGRCNHVPAAAGQQVATVVSLAETDESRVAMGVSLAVTALSSAATGGSLAAMGGSSAVKG